MDTSFRIEFEFLGDKLEFTMNDRHDPTVMKCIVDIQSWEEEKGRGLEYMTRMETAGLVIGDEQVHNKIKEILLNRHKHERKE